MSARQLATLCLISSALCLGRPEPVDPPERAVVVYLKVASGQPSGPVEQMKRELSALMDTAGYRVSWIPAGQSSDVADATLVVVELRGTCQAPRNDVPVEHLARTVSLASTAVSDGKVLPFSWLDCATLDRLLASALGKERDPKREYLYGRAMGRLLAHELFHVLTNTRDHDDAGVAKPSFSAKDVLAERFEFELPTLTRFRDPGPSSGGVADGDAEADESGR